MTVCDRSRLCQIWLKKIKTYQYKLNIWSPLYTRWSLTFYSSHFLRQQKTALRWEFSQRPPLYRVWYSKSEDLWFVSFPMTVRMNEWMDFHTKTNPRTFTGMIYSEPKMYNIKPHKCLSAGEWISKMWYIYTMEYHLVIKGSKHWHILQHEELKNMLSVRTLGKVQESDTCCMILFMKQKRWAVKQTSDGACWDGIGVTANG